MNKQPVYYMQTDARWKNEPYRVTGETSTVGGSGCGPSCAAMVIETLTGKTFTPLDACNWSVQHGYKALNQGTYYSYFKPQFAAFDILADQLSWSNVYGKPNDPIHTTAFNMLKDGYYIIACMGPGTWTTGGHFVLVWWEDGKVRINDPASTKENRLNGDIKTFKSQVKYYWWIDAREYNGDDDMTQEQFNEMFDVAMAAYNKKLQDNDAGSWSEEDRKWGIEKGLFRGSGKLPNGDYNYMWEFPLTREAAVALFHRYDQSK